MWNHAYNRNRMEKIKGEALQNVKKVSDEIKPIMAYDTANNTGDEW